MGVEARGVKFVIISIYAVGVVLVHISGGSKIS
jgi:hypothetical protein